MPQTVFVDANVLYSKTLRDWVFLSHLNAPGMFTLVSSEDVIAEVIHSYRRAHPNAPGRTIASIRERIVESLSDLVRDFDVDDSFPGKDRDDRHIHAAARARGADILLTNDDGFAEANARLNADALGYEVLDTDSFLTLVDASAPDVVRQVTLEQIRYWLAKCGEFNLPESLMHSGCPNFAERVREHQLALDDLTELIATEQTP